MIKKVYKILITCIIFLITIILFKKSDNFKSWYQEHILNNNLSFTLIASKYESLFGSPFPFKRYFLEPVFDEKLKYNDITEYKNGYLVDLENNLIPSLSDGMVIFIGEKDNELCVVVEEELLEISYCMLENVGVKLYDYVSKGSYIGEANQRIFLVFTKSGEYLDYEEFI